jgi:hypothetical protein
MCGAGLPAVKPKAPNSSGRHRAMAAQLSRDTKRSDRRDGRAAASTSGTRGPGFGRGGRPGWRSGRRQRTQRSAVTAAGLFAKQPVAAQRERQGCGPWAREGPIPGRARQCGPKAKQQRTALPPSASAPPRRCALRRPQVSGSRPRADGVPPGPPRSSHPRFRRAQRSLTARKDSGAHAKRHCALPCGR